MFPLVMFVQDVGWHETVGIQEKRLDIHLRHPFQYGRMINSFCRIFSPSERTVVPDNDSRYREDREISFPQRFYDYLAGIPFVVRFGFFPCQQARTRYRTVKVVRLGRSQGGNLLPRLGKGRRIR